MKAPYLGLILGGKQEGPADIVPICDNQDGLFPGSIFDDGQLRHGAIVLYFVCAFYSFCVIAVVCENYFLPTVEVICEELGLAPDVAAATFMSFASSAPELFVNIVTTFLTKSTMGVGTTVGSATFNVLGLASFSGLAAQGFLDLQAGLVMRDSLIYVTAIGVTTAVVWDGRVEWWEALTMVLCSLMYLAFMFTHHSLARWARSLLSRSNSTVVLTTAAPPGTPGSNIPAEEITPRCEVAVIKCEEAGDVSKPDPVPSPLKSEKEAHAGGWSRCARASLLRLWQVLSWPVCFVLSWTIINTSNTKLRRFYLLSFFLCVVWIALAAYVVSWMLAVIGKTLMIPDAVMGITLLAAGGSTPEAVSAVIMARKGIGSTGIANGLGANTLNMLMNLGLPWLVRSLLAPHEPWNVLSEGLPFDLVCLISAVILLNIILLLFKYRLSRRQGMCSFVVYLVIVVILILIELNVFNLYTKSPCTS